MTRKGRRLVVIGAVLVVVGIALAARSKEWIEETFGVDPDAGNGLLELALAVVPIVAGLALIVTAVVGARRSTHAAVPRDP